MTSICLKVKNLSESLNTADRNGKPEDDITEINQRENIFLEPHKKATKTPLKQQSSTSHSVLGAIRTDLGTMTTPTKLQESPVGEPWTPTANLKMLISAASPEIRSREKMKQELLVDDDHASETNENLQDQLSGEEFEKFHPSRKEKSLGLLCYRFLARYPDYPNPAVNNDICLDEVATELNVERRRIYDIVNVLESLHMVSRLAKNRYTWHGRHNLAHTLGTLKNVGEDQKYAEQMLHIKKKGFELHENYIKEPLREQNLANSSEVKPKEMYFVELPGMEFRAASVNGRKDKSLRVMSQKFVMLFLVSKPRVVSLDTAAKILIGDDQKVDLDHSKFKTKIRRLYDIANVLTSLELIKKVHVTEVRGRKPAFKWIGPEAFPDLIDVKPITLTTSAAPSTVLPKISKEAFAKNLFPASNTKQGFTRHASLNYLLQNMENDHRKISSAPSSPVGKIYSDSSKAGLYPSKMDQLATICKLQLEAQSNLNASKLITSPSKPCSSQEKSKLDNPPGLVEPALCTGVNSAVFPQVKPTFQPLEVFPLVHGQYSSVLPVMLPQSHSNGPYTICLQPPQPRNLSAHPSGFVQSISFATEKQMISPHDSRNHSNKRIAEMCSDGPETDNDNQNSKAAKRDTLPDRCLKQPSIHDISEVLRSKAANKSESQPAKDVDSGTSPNEDELLEIHQARLKARRSLITNRASPRALHLDPEFLNAPEDKSLGSEKLEHSVECFLENEEKCGIILSEGKATTVKAVPVAIAFPAHLHSVSETVMSSGYLIPLPQQASFNNSSNGSPEMKNKCVSSPEHQLYHSPLSGVTPMTASDYSPANFSATHITSLKLPYPVAVASSVASLPVVSQANISSFASSGHHFPIHSPSPGILNFTLQNLGLINPGVHFSMSQGPTMATASPEQANPLTGNINLQQGKMIFVKPVSPHHQLTGQPVALISIQQHNVPATPEGAQSINRESFFRTPGGPTSASILSSVTAVVTNNSKSPPGNMPLPQRKLEVCAEDFQ
ncbi:transcription factor E2F8 [Carcharodon carcharias]|uniref:transcription factor E2F8 n=1 Tax=Carcharodon carcharias TaxID=13397 RepID=UPI001B7F5695|nr:transcription factor E2F8 [Carcharodon carcharias]XP_041053715.1 transcription factor E2F8 [Carcharodon carcharias]